MTHRTRRIDRISRALRFQRCVWLLLLSLTLAAGPGIARAVVPGTNGSPAGVSPHAGAPDADAAPVRLQRAQAMASLAIQADETETPDPDEDATETPDNGNDATANGDAAQTFEDYLDQVADEEPVFGPVEGDLEHQSDAVTFLPAEVDLQNFVVHAEFTNPYDADDNPWDIGFIFRLSDDDPHLRLIITSAGNWALTPALEAPLDEGTVDGLNLRADQRNVIDLVVDGDTGYFGVNGDFVAELDLSEVSQSGDVAIATAFFVGNFQEGEATGYEDFIIWELPSDTVTPEPSETVTAEPDESATAEPRESVTAEPDESATAEPDESVTAEPDETVTAEPDESATAEPDESATAEPRETATSTARTETYESPTYGYTVDYGADWSVSDESSDGGVDSVRFDNSVSTIDFIGYESDLTPAECVADEQAYYESTDGYDNVEVALDENDNELLGEFDDPIFGASSYGVFSFTYTPDGGDPTDYVSYVECRPLEAGVSLLRIVHFAAADDYNDEIEARIDLLDGVDFTGATPDETVTAEPDETGTAEPDETGTAEPDETGTAEPDETVTPEPEDTVTPNPEAGYESPTYGYTLAFGEDWTIDSEDSANGVDSVRVTNGVSTVDLIGYETDLTPAECVDDEIAYYEDADGYSSVEPLLDENDDEVRGETRDSAFAAVTFTYEDANGDETDYVAYVECRDLETQGTQLKIVQFAPPDDYATESDARDELLNGLSLNGAGSDVTPTEDVVTPEATEEDQTPEPANGLAVTLEPVGTADATGLASIEPDGNRVNVVVVAVGVDDGAVAMIQEGTCDDLPGEAAFELDPLESGTSETRVTASIDELITSDYAITIHESEETLDEPLVCGEIGA